MAASERIIGGFIFDVSVRMECLEAFVVGGLGADFADAHDFITRDADWVAETVAVPKLEQRNV